MRKDEAFYALKTRSVERHDADVFYFRFDRCGWAVVLVDEVTGTMSIHSDYGDWNFSWPKPGRGDHTLKEFFDSADCDYLARKFMLGRRGEVEEFDLEATLAAFKKRVIADRKELVLRKDKARVLFNELKKEHDDNEILFHEHLSGEIYDWLGGAPYEFFERVETSTFLWLKHGVIPAIKSGLQSCSTQGVNVEAKRA